MILSIGKTNEALLPVEELTEFLQLGIDETGNTRQTALLVSSLLTSIVEIENKTGQHILSKPCTVDMLKTAGTKIPFGSTTQISNIRIFDQFENQFFDFVYNVQTDCTDLIISWSTTTAKLFVKFQIGHQSWASVPSDLQQAVIGLSAHNYRTRFDEGSNGQQIPKFILGLIEKYRKIRV